MTTGYKIIAVALGALVLFAVLRKVAGQSSQIDSREAPVNSYQRANQLANSADPSVRVREEILPIVPRFGIAVDLKA